MKIRLSRWNVWGHVFRILIITDKCAEVKLLTKWECSAVNAAYRCRLHWPLDNTWYTDTAATTPAPPTPPTLSIQFLLPEYLQQYWHKKTRVVIRLITNWLLNDSIFYWSINDRFHPFLQITMTPAGVIIWTTPVRDANYIGTRPGYLYNISTHSHGLGYEEIIFHDMNDLLYHLCSLCVSSLSSSGLTVLEGEDW